MTILGQMAKALKMDSEEMRELFSDGVQSMRMNYYPPCPEPDMAIGFSPHSDADALTILYQLNDINGLQIRKEGKWVPVKPLQNGFVVNIGDIMEVILVFYFIALLAYCHKSFHTRKYLLHFVLVSYPSHQRVPNLYLGLSVPMNLSIKFPIFTNRVILG